MIEVSPLESLESYVYICPQHYTSSAAMRTNIGIDDALLKEAMRATVEEALRRVVTTGRRQQAIADIAGTGWDGDLEAMRTGQPG
jgi:Arc/MetJ family transcription regulator